MNYTIHISTITPLHIGSGKDLLANYEYLYFGEMSAVVLAKEEQILEIFRKENIQEWLRIIDKKGDLLKALFDKTDSIDLKKLARRIIPVRGADKPDYSQNIKEQLFNGLGKPLVPGSSIKGAIRTAIFTHNLRSKRKIMTDRSLFVQEKFIKGSKQMVMKDYGLEKQLLGNDPNHDIFRLLRVGDVLFEDTEAFRSFSLNKGREGWFRSDKISAFMECIPAERDSLFNITIPKDLIREAEKKKYFHQNYHEILLPKVFSIINQHTGDLLRNEITFWEKDKGQNHQILQEYKQTLNDLLLLTEQCGEDECILRLGGGSGVDAITGDWQADLFSKEDYKKWVSQFKGSAIDLGFPKTRRLAHDQSPLGFVKLKLLNSEEGIAQIKQKIQSASVNDSPIIVNAKSIKVKVEASFTKAKIEKNAIIEAVATTKGMMKTFCLYLNEGKTQDFQFRYPSDDIDGKVFLFKIEEVKFGIITRISIKGFKA